MPSNATGYDAEYQLSRYHRHRAILIEELGGVCVSCNCTERLEFDHIDPQTKSFDIGKFFNRKLDILREEAAKCQLLCRPCHIIKTKENGDNHQPWPLDKVKHGTHQTRYTRKCKCELCEEYARKRNIRRRVSRAVG